MKPVLQQTHYRWAWAALALVLCGSSSAHASTAVQETIDRTVRQIEEMQAAFERSRIETDRAREAETNRPAAAPNETVENEAVLSEDPAGRKSPAAPRSHRSASHRRQ